MPTPPNPIRLLLLLAASAAIALSAGGCGTSTANVDRGRELFIQKCGECHAMAEAGSSGQVGPNLDDAFAAARASGQTSSTIKGVTEAQVAYPRPMKENPAVSMPADIVTGQDLEDVAAYVGAYAGVPGAAPPKVPGGPGAQVFANNGCAGCHTFAAANAGGVSGPNLDESLAGQSLAMIEKSIVEPDADIVKGFPPIMPDNYETLMTSAELKDLAEFLAESQAGGGKGGGSK